MNRNNKFLNMKKINLKTVYNFTSNKDNIDTNFDTNANESKKNESKKFLLKDQINLKIVPLIKKKKCVFKYENLISSRNKDKKNNFSIGDKCSKSYTKKSKFESPFEKRKTYKYILRDIVNLSKRFHSPKYKEANLHRDILKTYSRNEKNNFFRISKTKNSYLKTWENTKHIFKNLKLNNYNKKMNDNNKIQTDEEINENFFLSNIIKNKERNRRGKNYYNQIHVNKMNKIIEKFSFNNMS